MIVDGHCHFGPRAGIGGADAFRRYLARAASAGIGRSVVFSAFADDYSAANRAVARLVASSRGRLLGFACVHAARDRGRIGAMILEGRRLGLRGLKVHARDAAITDEVCVAARGAGWPVLYDPMGEVALVEHMAARHPAVRFVIPHLGSFQDDVRAQLAFLPILARTPNLLADTSGVKIFDVLVEAVGRAGPRKLIFGSDGPWLHPGLELAKVRALGLAPADLALVLRGNIVTLLEAAAPLGEAHLQRPPRDPQDARGPIPVSAGFA